MKAPALDESSGLALAAAYRAWMSAFSTRQQLAILVVFLLSVLSGVAHYAGFPAVAAFVISGVALAGLAIVALAGNAVENFAGISLARKGQSGLAISIVKSSVSQIAVFLFPLLILISLLFAVSLTFVLAPIWIGALVMTGIALWQISGDGETNPFERAALIAFYQ